MLQTGKKLELQREKQLELLEEQQSELQKAWEQLELKAEEQPELQEAWEQPELQEAWEQLELQTWRRMEWKTLLPLTLEEGKPPSGEQGLLLLQLRTGEEMNHALPLLPVEQSEVPPEGER